MLAFVRIASENNIKSAPVRRFFTRRLIKNMEEAFALHALKVEIRSEWGRIFFEYEDTAALDVASRIFGVHSVSPVETQCAPSIEQMCETALRLYPDRVKGKRFAVRANRAGVPGFTSMDVERSVGAVLRPFAARVDLSHPEVVIGVEVRKHGAYFFCDRVTGPQGLPVGVEGRALCLISGGFDSAVAAWYMLKRGVEVDFLFCNLAGAAFERSVMKVCKGLVDQWCYGYRPKLFVAPFASIVDEIKTKTNPKFAQLILKRFMYRCAAQIAERQGAVAIITGEAIGQVSSQTLHNLCALDTSLPVGVLRPLVGFDKTEIIQKSREMGTYALSEHVQEYCNISGKYPITRGDRARIDAEELVLSSTLWQESAREARFHDLRSMDLATLTAQHLFVDHVPNGASVIDCRSLQQFEKWHYPGSRNVPLEELLGNFKNFQQAPTYVIYCPFGLESALAAEKMQEAGFAAYSFLGGTQNLRRYGQVQAPVHS